MNKDEIKKLIEVKVKKHNQLQVELLKTQGEIRVLNEILKTEEPKKDEPPKNVV